MVMLSKREQRERVIEVTKTKQEILQKKRKILFPRSEADGPEHMREMNGEKQYLLRRR